MKDESVEARGFPGNGFSRNGDVPAAPYVPRPFPNGLPETLPPPPEAEDPASAERSVLLAMLTQRAALGAALVALRRDSFDSAFHRVLFGAMAALRARGEPVDFVSVRDALIRQGKLEAAGGADYLDALFDAPFDTPTALGADAAIRAVAEKARQDGQSWQDGPSRGAARPSARPGPAARLPDARNPLSRKPIAERVVDLADIGPPGELPLLFGPYLLQGASHWLTGATGLGKSTLLFNLACALAEGTPLWGIECQQTKVLYADMESGDVGRAHKIERLYQDAPRVRGWLSFLREPVKLPDELDELLDYVQAEGIGLVVFDTARRVFRVRDENDNAEVYNQIVPTLDALKRIGAATLTLGHPPKNGSGGARGAGAQEDAGDVNLTLTMHRGEVSDADGVIALRVTKNRLLGLGVPPLLLRRIGGDRFARMEEAQSRMDEALMADGREAAPRGDVPTAGGRCAEDVLRYLGGRTEPARFTDIVAAMEQGGYATATAKRVIKALQTKGRISHDGTGYVAEDGPE